jgi:hypothetical protein
VRLRQDILPPEQQALLPRLAPARDIGYVLYGGTAVALQLGHRVSVDFDFFASGEVDREQLAAKLGFLQTATVLQDAPNTFVVLVPVAGGHVKLSFFGGIRFGRINDPIVSEDGVLLVASLQDLLASKVKVILQRSEAKDYRDIAAMIRHGVDLPLALAAAQQMYSPAYPVQAGLKALTYFGDGDLATLSAAERKLLVDAAAAVRDLPPVSIRPGLLPA